MSARRYHSDPFADFGWVSGTPWNMHLFELQGRVRQGKLYRLLKRRAAASLSEAIKGWHHERSRRRFDLAEGWLPR